MRFYQEFLDTHKTKPSGNCLAIPNNAEIFWFWPDGVSFRPMACYKGVAATALEPNSPTICQDISRNYLRRRCKRVTRAAAEQIHPELAKFLRDNEETTTND